MLMNTLSKDLISRITANEKNKFTKQELASFSINQLSGIASLIKEDEAETTSSGDFSGQGDAEIFGNEEGDDPLTVPVFEAK